MARNRLAAIVESSADAIIAKTLDGTITTWNSGAQKLYGYSPAEAIGRNFSILLPPGREGELPDILRRVAGGQSVGPFETLRRAKDGHDIDVSLAVSPLKDDAGRIVGASTVARDITERKKAEKERERLLESERKARAEAEAASQTKDEFLALVSHELRTPITSILGWSWLLRSGHLGPGERESALEVIERNVQVEKQIIDDLLDVSSLARHQLSIKKQVLDLGELAADTAAGLQSQFQAKSLRLVCAPASGLLVDGDPRRLRQVFWNILSNAAKFTPEGGTVTVVAGREQGDARITIEDTGPGMGLEYYARLFELFGQQENVLTRAHGGLGLGLAIVKQLIDLHGGTVAVAPPIAGQGTRISVSLPLAVAAAAAPSLAPGSPEAAAERIPHCAQSLCGVDLLVVEDDVGTRQMLLTVLEHSGANAQGAASAAEGFAAFMRARPHVLISDIAMPEEDGYSLIRRIRALRPEDGGEVPAAALSAYSSAEDRAKALRAGFQMHIRKPVDPPDLLTAVRALTGKNDPRPQ
jgi:PAS domain S-box-containing protein